MEKNGDLIKELKIGIKDLFEKKLKNYFVQRHF